MIHNLYVHRKEFEFLASRIKNPLTVDPYNMLIHLFIYRRRGKWAEGAPHGKWVPPAMDNRNTSVRADFDGP